MAFDALIANAGRLQILTALAVEERQEFVRLRTATQLTDGNLASHARRLQSGGMIAIDKEFRGGKPVTHFTLTAQGRKALESHTRRLIAAISHRRLAPADALAPAAEGITSAKPAAPKGATPADSAPGAAPSPLADQLTSEEDDWID